ncbi:MAG: methylated-DNA--[protein]-cysteine S-methyltransferase [Candidatus Omnitrophota bacterium]|nr:MAG: methylated-DNA--[protein]-cysteine S-methyltransferase [Candidatus Omnitrophota bacterium]
MDIEKRLKKIPTSPGVYLFLGKNKEVLYIGKASNLKKRINSYFQKKYRPPRTESLVSRIRDLDYIPTSSTAEALIYEANLIKQKKPKYNVELKDDKSYPFLKLTITEKFPRLFITRQRKKDRSLYYGPYTNVKLLKKALSVIRSTFLLRSCKRMPKKPCLKAHIKQCVSPCNGSITEEKYKKIADDARLFLEGRKKDLLKRLSDRMKKASKNLDYEKAIALRDEIEALSAMWKGRRPPPPLNREISRLKDVLGLRVLPARIEAFDISDISGKEAVGSMVSFFSGRPQKDEYRRFRIKNVTGIDDYACLREVIRRRYARLLKEEARLPDLILIDGGRGHLNVARDELDKIGPVKIPVISIAKEKEYIYVDGKKPPLVLPRSSPALKLIMRIRDEAHRFAISYHKLLRSKSLFNDKKHAPPTVRAWAGLTPFQRRVYRAVSSIPPGEVRSYKWVAEKIGAPRAYRAVGHALKKNPYVGIIPCHRVIKSNGSLGGFSKGKSRKRGLLKREGLDVG